MPRADRDDKPKKPKVKTVRTPMALDYRMVWTMLGGNLGGALLTVAYTPMDMAIR